MVTLLSPCINKVAWHEVLKKYSCFTRKMQGKLSPYEQALIGCKNKGRFCNNGEIVTNFKAIIYREQIETLSTNKGRFCNNSEIVTNFKAIINREQSETLLTVNSKQFLCSIVYL